MTSVYLFLAILYILLGMYTCKQYIDKESIDYKKKKNINMVKRVLHRLSIILFYPLYGFVLCIGLFIELLTEDKPFE